MMFFKHQHHKKTLQQTLRALLVNLLTILDKIFPCLIYHTKTKFFSPQPMQPIKLSSNFLGSLPVGVGAYALVLTNKLKSSSSDGQRHFELL